LKLITFFGYIGEGGAVRVLVRGPEHRNRLEDVIVDGWIIFKSVMGSEDIE
jgi:hypothetical protein